MATSDAALAARFIQRAKFAATPRDIADYQALGPTAWLDRHFAVPRGQSGADWLTANGHAAVTKEARYFWPQAGDHMIWNQLIAQPDENYARKVIQFCGDGGTGVQQQVTTFTASDFGRTLVNNGDGSDHGWGSHHFELTTILPNLGNFASRNLGFV